jgi:tripartite-type tricarboxylate transporter receptor subunit TctC
MTCKMFRRAVLVPLMLLGVLQNAPTVAQPYPSAPVRIIMPTGAGSGPDVIGRIVAEQLARAWGQQPVVVNHPGAAGAIAMRVAGNAPADGYTLLQALGSSFIALPEIEAKFPFSLARDFVPVGLVGEQPFVIAANPSLGVTTLAQLIALAKQRPQGLNIAVLSRGGLPHLTAEWLRLASGAPFTSVHYPSTPAALNDVVAGRVEAIIESLPGLRGSIEGGSLRLLAIASPQRIANLPHAPLASETLPGFAATGWFALMARAGTPHGIVRKVSDDLRSVLSRSTVRQRFQELGTYTRPMSPEELAGFIAREQQQWKPVIARVGLSRTKGD